MDNERFNEIRILLTENKSVTVNELAKNLFVSPATVRRDLTEMEKQGLLKRTHGGAILNQNTDEESAFSARKQKNQSEKRRIAAVCIELLHGNSTLFLDGSSSVNCLVPFLSRYPQINAVTNGVHTAIELSKLENLNVHIAGGELKNFGNSTLGNRTISFLQDFYFDFAVLSCSGLTADGIFTDGNSEQSAIKKLVAKNSAKVIMLVDSSKFGLTFMNKNFDLNAVDYIITDATPPYKFVGLINNSNCKLIVNGK